VTPHRLLAERLRSHRLSAPAATVHDAAAHMLAVQAQEFRGGRWALASRTRGAPGLAAVDAAFDAGHLVRSWTMRGTIHIVPARDLAWMLQVTGARQARQADSRRRALGLEPDAVGRAERAIVGALVGGGRMTHAEIFALLEASGIPPTGQRGYHLLYALSVAGVLVQGPVVARGAGSVPTREQCFVLADEWIADSAHPADPLVELFVRYVDGHGPARAADFAWWAGLPLGLAREAAAAAADRLVEVDDGAYMAPDRPRRHRSAPDVIALAPFDEYYLSYADRSPVCPPELAGAVGPGANGLVRPLLLARGRVVGVWTHSVAAGRHADDPVPDLLAPRAATGEEVAAALDRYARFIAG